MIRHIVIAALRNMVANRLLSAIAILGLAVGITAVLTVVSLIRGLDRWDEFIPDYERTIVVTMPPTRHGAPYTMSSDRRIAGLLKLALPEIENVARLTTRGAILRHGNVTARESFYWADPSTFDVLPFPVYRGDLKSALAAPDGIVLERGTARKYFGRDDVIGEVISLNGHAMTIRAVLEDLPSQTELSPATFISNLSPIAETVLSGSEIRPDDETITYVRLKPGVVLDTIRQKAHDAIMPVLAERPLKGSGADADAPLLLRIDGTVESEKFNPGVGQAFAFGMGIGLLLLFIASVNFVNMMTARAARRATEVSMRKVSGASRGDLILQFLGEAILTVFLSTCLALALNEWTLGKINGLGQAIPFDFWRNPPLLGALLLGVLVLGVVAGAWPAFVLSSFRPVRVLKGVSADVGRAGFIRNGLVTLQFAALIGFTITAIVNYEQHVFAVNRSLGIDIDRMLTVRADCRPAFRTELRKLAGVAGVSCTGGEFLSNDNTTSFPYRGAPMTLDMVRADWGAFALYGIRPLAGSLATMAPFGDSGSGVTQGVVLNQSAVRRLGFASPQAAIGQVLTQAGPLSGLSVTAVVPDFALYSIERPMEATIFVPTSFAPGSGLVSIKLRPRQVAETLDAIDHAWSATGDHGPIQRRFLDQQVQAQYDGIVQSANLFAICALVAVFLACLGLTGLAISNAERRTKEIGIRKVMGASVGTIVTLLLLQFSRPVLWANLIAWPLAWYGLRQYLSGFAYHIDLHWWVFAAAGLLALLIALATVAGHAIWAARQKPVLALRYE